MRYFLKGREPPARCSVHEITNCHDYAKNLEERNKIIAADQRHLEWYEEDERN